MAIGKRRDQQAVHTEISASSEARPETNVSRENKESRQVENTPFSFIPVPPKYSFNDVILPEKTLDSIRNALAIKEKGDFVFGDWGLSQTHKHASKIGINLYGPPGTGKTMVAHAIANHLNMPLMIINYADIESKYVGDTPKNLTKAFQTAEQTGSVLFFDEADAILSRRVTNMNNATDTSVNQTRSVMLTLLNDYKSIILFTTNYISNFDPAFMRRILAHIEFELPDAEGRARLLRKLIPPQMPNDIRIEETARQFDGISGSDISNAVLMAAFKGAGTSELIVRHEHLFEALSSIKKSIQANNNVTIETRPVSEAYVKQQLGNHFIQGGQN